MVKTLPANAGDIRDPGLIPGLGKSPWKEASIYGETALVTGYKVSIKVRNIRLLKDDAWGMRQGPDLEGL